MTKHFNDALREAFYEGMTHAIDARDEYAPHGPDRRSPEQAFAEWRREWSGLSQADIDDPFAAPQPSDDGSEPLSEREQEYLRS